MSIRISIIPARNFNTYEKMTHLASVFLSVVLYFLAQFSPVFSFLSLRIANRLISQRNRGKSTTISVESSNTCNSVDKLLPPPRDGTIGNFIDPMKKEMQFLPCNLFATGRINNELYGVGYPVDMPVMLTYLEDNKLKPVHPDYCDYDHLINHVSVQLEGDDLFLIPTPIVLTLQGEFEEEEFNDPNPFVNSFPSKTNAEDMMYDRGEDDSDELEDISSLEGLIREDEEDDEEGDYDDDDDDDDDESDWYSIAEGEDVSNSSGAVVHASDRDSSVDPLQEWLDNCSPSTHASPDYAFPRKRTFTNKNKDSNNDYDGKDEEEEEEEEEDVDFSKLNIPEDAFVTAEDTANMQREHRLVDRFISFASDMKLIGTFHYKKKNFHLVRLLEPIFVMGKQLKGRKELDFALLSERETEEVRPVLERLLLNTTSSDTATETDRPIERGSGRGGGRGAGRSDRGNDERSDERKRMVGRNAGKGVRDIHTTNTPGLGGGESERSTRGVFERAKRRWEEQRS